MTRVLLIEDEPELRAMLSEELEELGHEVRAAEHGAAALAVLAEWSPDLILCDLAMPVMSGLEFLRAYPERVPEPRAPVVVVSAFSTAADMADAEAAGAVQYLRKPLDFDALETLVAKHAPAGAV